MPGPEPSPNRRHRQTPVKEQQRVYLPPEGRTGRAPAVPSRRKLLKSSRDQWAAWWRSPMAVMWDTRFDVHPLSRLLELEDRRRGGEDLPASILTQMRMIEDDFGLNPRSRKELGWVIAEPRDTGQEEPDEGQGRAARPERYGHLKVVDDALAGS